ncbi:hypothetical protein DFH29DRAFT_876911 [Suillus ampliporus]|nr:hypothetical protein DFH29DRAFT_876911 [Suillus ampliporus]
MGFIVWTQSLKSMIQTPNWIKMCVTRQRAPTQTPQLTQWSTHVPSAPLSRVPPSDDVIDPTLLQHREPQERVFSQPLAWAVLGYSTAMGRSIRACRIIPLASLLTQPVDADTAELSLFSSPVPQHPRVSALTSSGLGIKRAGYPSLATTEGLQVVKKVKVGEGGTCGRLCSADFDKLYAATVHLAISHYQSILANLTIYPNDIQAQDWSGQAWAAACCSQGIQIDFDEDVYKLITECGSNLRSDLKTILCPLIETEFGFSNEKTPEAIKSNAVHAATVLANRKLLMCKDCEAGKGLFETDIIVDGVIKWCYNKKNSLGATLPSYFKDSTTGGASWGIIAAVLTGACIAEWTSGTKSEMRFYKERYATIFDIYFNMLVKFHEGMKHVGVLPKICKRVLRHARRHASVPEDPFSMGGSTENFSTDEFTAAAAEWDGRVESDEEYY